MGGAGLFTQRPQLLKHAQRSGPQQSSPRTQAHLRNDCHMDIRRHEQKGLLGSMPRHRARGRSARREGDPITRERTDFPRGEGAVPPRPVDAAKAAAAQEAVRMAAEVAEIALTAAALMMRELLVRLEGSAPDTKDRNHRPSADSEAPQ